MAYEGNEAQHYVHRAAGGGANVREDLSDIITIVDPVDTPLMAMLEHVTVNSVKPEWLTDNINFDDDPQNIQAAAKFAGSDADFVAQTGRTRIFNYQQINSRAIDVTGTQRAVNNAGMTDELGYQAERHLLELGREVEYAAHWGIMADVLDATETQAAPDHARNTSGVLDWILDTGLERDNNPGTTVTMGHALVTSLGGTAVVPPEIQSFCLNTDETGLSLTTFDRVVFNNLMAGWWDIGGVPQNSVALCGTALKRAVAGFSLSANLDVNERQIPAAAKELVDTIDVIDTDHGRVYINLDRYLNINNTGDLLNFPGRGTAGGANDVDVRLDGTFMVFQPDYWKVGVLRQFGLKPLAPIGDSDKILVVGEWGIVAQNPKMGAAAVNFA